MIKMLLDFSDSEQFKGLIHFFFILPDNLSYFTGLFFLDTCNISDTFPRNSTPIALPCDRLAQTGTVNEG